MDVTVVVASIDAARSIDLCLTHLERECEGLRAELIVADASGDDTAALVKAHGGSAILLRCPSGTLAPELWAAGYRRSTGRVVAFTTGHCLVGLVAHGWAAALIGALDAGATGAGGPLVIADRTGPLDWAIFYLRYAGSMPHTLGAGPTDGEIAGDNAAYRRDALDRHSTTFDRGFWEVDFHRLVRAEGGRLTAVPQAVIAFGPSFPARTILRHRVAHGRHFGAGRVAARTRTAWQIVLAAPLVPFVLAGRAGIRAMRGPSPWRFVAALPWFLVLAGAWAIGEAWGALRGDVPAAPRGPEC